MFFFIKACREFNFRMESGKKISEFIRLPLHCSLKLYNPVLPVAKKNDTFIYLKKIIVNANKITF